MNKRLLSLCLLVLVASAGFSQRFMDTLDRGLVATVGMSGSGNFVSWRIFGDEYFDVTYNLYANGALIKSDLKVSNYYHSAGNASTKYQVAPVVRGVEGEKCAEVVRWAGISNLTAGVSDNPHTGYLDINGQQALDRNGADVTASYVFNDVVPADVDGDGQVDLICKRNFTGDVNNASNTTCFHRIEVVKLDGTRLWWIDLGPNMMAGPDEQWDAIAFDWDMDGRAEVLLRGADNMIIHKADGSTVNIGNMNFVASRTQYTCEGNEYLLYIDGMTGVPFGCDASATAFTPMAYPLKRYEAGESNSLEVWGKDGDGGHRSCKHYFGAPYLDGQRPSIFLGRGAYTRHKFCALDVDPASHNLTERWRWTNNKPGSPWYGNGYHNFAIQDVDMDGRDEIVFGSMVIDDNGMGLSTTGLGHGDAQHCGDLDPYRWGLEQFGCNETQPAMNYRNATTSEMYYRIVGSGDDGRALAGNFTNKYPGCVGQSATTGVVSLTADKAISDLGGYALNFRIYWDGDLCEEILDSPGTEKAAKIEKLDGGRIFNSEGNLNNSSKNNPCLTGDILGDWREELLVRYGTGMRLYTTSRPTSYRIPTLWHDHGYRQGMVWETIGYNQPPHTSYFLGQLEGITSAPPSLTTTGRDVIAGGSIGSAYDDRQVLVYAEGDNSVSIDEGASPWVVVFNVPAWVQGTNPSESFSNALPTTTFYTCTATGGGFSGATQLVKQGEGELILPAVAMNHTGNTDVWNGTLTFDGSLLGSTLWLNRHTALNAAGSFRCIKADYNASVRPGGVNRIATLTTDSLVLGFGSRVVFDLDGSSLSADKVVTPYLSIGTKSWDYGPKYMSPVFEFNAGENVAPGKYLLVSGIERLVGNIKNIIIEGLGTEKTAVLSYEEGCIFLSIEGAREATHIVWNGSGGTTWDFGTTANFTLEADPSVTDASFVSGDVVTFNNDASRTTVSLKGDLEADSVIVDATKAYTFNGTGALVGNTTLVKRGTGKLTISNDNTYTGGTRISGGTVVITALSNDVTSYGNLGGVNTLANRFIIENGAVLQTSGVVTQGSPMQMLTDEGGVINNAGDFVVNKPISGTLLTKQGTGWMKFNDNNSLTKLSIAAGTVQCISCSSPAKTVEFLNGSLIENGSSSYAIEVPKGKMGTWNTTNNASYTNKLSGEGTLTVYCEEVKGSGWFATRTQLCMDFQNFKGIIKATGRSDDEGARWTLNTDKGMPEGTLNIASGLTVQNTGKTFAIGKVTGMGALGGYASFSNNGGSGANTWKLGNADDWTWGGIITANSSFIKTGTGKATFTGAHDYTGTTSIEAGELRVSGNKVTLGTGSLTVKRGATLSGSTGSSVLTNSLYSIQAGATLQVDNSSDGTAGKFDFGGKNVTLAANSFLTLTVNSLTNHSTLKNINKLTMNGTIRLRLPDGWTPAVGDELTLYTDVTTLAGTPKLESEVINAEAGLYWDTSDLASKGILRVTSTVPVGLQAIDATRTDLPVYTLDGRRVNRVRSGQVYIIGGEKVLVK